MNAMHEYKFYYPEDNYSQMLVRYNNSNAKYREDLRRNRRKKSQAFGNQVVRAQAGRDSNFSKLS